MTPQEKLHTLETTIRKSIPRLMEVSEGCILKRKSHFELYSDYVILKIKRDDFSTYTEIDGKHKGSFSIENEKLLDHFEIIGHDILLSDVFEWLGTLFNFTIDHKGVIYQEFDYYFEGGLDRDYNEVAKVDFSKPYLKDQSEEFWDFLYNLR